MADYPGLEHHIVHPKGANIRKECEYCNKQKILIKNDVGYKVYLVDGKLCLDIGDNIVWLSDKLKYCPVCGRKI